MSRAIGSGTRSDSPSRGARLLRSNSSRWESGRGDEGRRDARGRFRGELTHPVHYDERLASRSSEKLSKSSQRRPKEAPRGLTPSAAGLVSAWAWGEPAGGPRRALLG